jgi:hypothetical protein
MKIKDDFVNTKSMEIVSLLTLPLKSLTFSMLFSLITVCA